MKKEDFENYESLLLDNQLCFPLYASSRLIIRLYTPILEPFGLTYTKYIVMLALWENDHLSVKDLGDKLFLDSGTLTPLLKKLEVQGLIHRERSPEDERNVMITLTKKGQALKEEALVIPQKVGACLNLNPEEFKELHRLLHLILKDSIKTKCGI
ncbi:MAG: MarR family transcriptional regulator [Tissierellales bacterium]|nr:MarR family transcriptional regulator [Tissierellales bacterium]MBN2826590.1 MarR family transcriptional regulator [Tissierellales bacterium]